MPIEPPLTIGLIRRPMTDVLGGWPFRRRSESTEPMRSSSVMLLAFIVIPTSSAHRNSDSVFAGESKTI